MVIEEKEDTIEFRVRDLETGLIIGYEWIENNMWHTNYTDKYCINEGGMPWLKGKREQYVGFKDKTSKKIYVSDIIKSDFGYGATLGDNPCVVELDEFYYWSKECCISDEIEIIGDKYSLNVEEK